MVNRKSNQRAQNETWQDTMVNICCCCYTGSRENIKGDNFLLPQNERGKSRRRSSVYEGTDMDGLVHNPHQHERIEIGARSEQPIAKFQPRASASDILQNFKFDLDSYNEAEQPEHTAALAFQ